MNKTKKKLSANQRLKKKNWNQWKASSLRSSWRSRAKKLGMNINEVPSRLEIQIWLETRVALGMKCYITTNKLELKDIELDHKVPTSRGGTFDLDNVGITCRAMNKAKGNMTLSEFKQLLKLIYTWEDNGDNLLSRLRCGNTIFKRR